RLEAARVALDHVVARKASRPPVDERKLRVLGADEAEDPARLGDRIRDEVLEPEAHEPSRPARSERLELEVPERPARAEGGAARPVEVRVDAPGVRGRAGIADEVDDGELEAALAVEDPGVRRRLRRVDDDARAGLGGDCAVDLLQLMA